MNGNIVYLWPVPQRQIKLQGPLWYFTAHPPKRPSMRTIFFSLWKNAFVAFENVLNIVQRNVNKRRYKAVIIWELSVIQILSSENNRENDLRSPHSFQLNNNNNNNKFLLWKKKRCCSSVTHVSSPWGCRELGVLCVPHSTWKSVILIGTIILTGMCLSPTSLITGSRESIALLSLAFGGWKSRNWSWGRSEADLQTRKQWVCSPCHSELTQSSRQPCPPLFPPFCVLPLSSLEECDATLFTYFLTSVPAVSHLVSAISTLTWLWTPVLHIMVWGSC